MVEFHRLLALFRLHRFDRRAIAGGHFCHSSCKHVAEVRIVGLGQFVGLLKLLGVQMLLKRFAQPLRHQDGTANLQEAHDEQGHERKRQGQKDDDIPQSQSLVIKDQHALAIRFDRSISGGILILGHRHVRRDDRWSDNGPHPRNDRGHDQQAATDPLEKKVLRAVLPADGDPALHEASPYDYVLRLRENARKMIAPKSFLTADHERLFWATD